MPLAWRAPPLLGALALVACACGASQHPGGEPDPCTDVELDVERIWSADVRAEFMGKGGSIGGQTRQVIATRLDDLSRDWAMLRRSVCLDHFKRHVIAKERYVARAECLDETLAHQRTLISVLHEGSERVDAYARLEELSREVGACRGR